MRLTVNVGVARKLLNSKFQTNSKFKIPNTKQKSVVRNQKTVKKTEIRKQKESNPIVCL